MRSNLSVIGNEIAIDGKIKGFVYNFFFLKKSQIFFLQAKQASSILAPLLCNKPFYMNVGIVFAFLKMNEMKQQKHHYES